MRSVSEKVFLITGSTDGLGKAVAERLAEQGAALILHGRNPEKGQTVTDELIRRTGNPKIVYYNADFSDLAQVRDFADSVLSAHTQLDVLINNAGIGGGNAGHREVSADGYELRFAVNYLSAFLLSHLLIPLLRQTKGSRIVMVASGSQQPIDFDNLMLEKNYSGSRAYAQSKLALVMLANTLSGKLKDDGILVNSLHPASMMDTQMVRNSGGAPRTSVSEGAESVLFVAASDKTSSVSGIFFDRKEPATADPQAYDDEARKRLYEKSAHLVGL